MTNDQLVTSYFAAMRARDLPGLLALFAPDAIMGLPNGRTFEGRAAIEQMFEGVFAAASPSPSCLGVIDGGSSIAAEIETALPGGLVRRTANFFDLNADGLIQGLRSYARG